MSGKKLRFYDKWALLSSKIIHFPTQKKIVFSDIIQKIGKTQSISVERNFFSVFGYQFFLQSQYFRGQKKINLLRKELYENISFCDLHNEGTPKSAISTKFPWGWNSFFSKKYKPQLFQQGLNRKLSTCTKYSIKKSLVFFLALHSWWTSNGKQCQFLEKFNFQTFHLSITTPVISSGSFQHVASHSIEQLSI